MWDGAREHGLICERASGILRVPCVLCLWLLWVRVTRGSVQLFIWAADAGRLAIGKLLVTCTCTEVKRPSSPRRRIARRREANFWGFV